MHMNGSQGGAPVIQLENASFGYADRRVLSGVTLVVEPGEVVAVLGPNGSGKSTLVRGLLGLTERLGGTVRLFGEPADKFDQHWRIGYVPQRHTLSASVRATVREIVAVGRLTRHKWWKPFWHKATDIAIVDRELEVVGLADRAGTDVATLSGGQQRRVLIARALASEPDVLLMDEPTAGVDTANQEVLAQVLAKLAARGTTMLIVTHELEALEDVVTRIVVVRAGRIAFDGTPEEFHSGEDHTRADHHHNGHHHDDELDPDHHPDPGRHPLPGAPGAGPLDPRRRTTP
jgi:zinc transport system ATP-binding protein